MADPTDYAKRLAALEKEMAAIVTSQKQIDTIQRSIKKRLDKTNDALEKINDGLNKLGDQFTDGLLQSASRFQEMVRMNQEQSLALMEQAKGVSAIEIRMGSIESWREEIAFTKPTDHALKALDQDANTVRLAARALEQHFGMAALDTLILDVFGLKAEPSEYGDTKRLKIRVMLKRAHEQGLLWNLINTAKEQRPNGLWPMDTGPLHE